MLRWIIHRFFFFLTFLTFFMTTTIQAENAGITLALHHVDLPDAIRMVAKFLKINVIISSSVKGVVTLNFSDAVPKDAMDILLSSHGLVKWKVGNIWLIAPQNELLKQKQDELKWREMKDAMLPLSTKIWKIKYAKAEDIVRIFQDEHAPWVSKRGRVRVDVRTNTICVQDIAERLDNIHHVIARLDVPVHQILIAARLVSVDSDFERELGIQFTTNSTTSENIDGIQKKSIGQEMGRYSLAIAKLADGSLLDVKLIALENAGHAELISSPSLFTTNQQPASIEAGEEVPYQEVSEGGGTAVVFKKAVLGLKVTPQVLPNNNVLLQLQINQDRPNSRTVMGMPVISTRQMVTSVLVKSGQTIVLGGIYESNKETTRRGIPMLSEIPLLGLLFKQSNTRKNKRELLIFVTPTIS
ncbi:MAG: type IV pilus secretin PilQ [Gammaproteobacteria bacterium]|nr:type IV pilus secretin PilQ [Gammaproteobacteria bacterium]MCW5583678.1 type IV pilus secretin PilQ [Gammaproteobacteria bacterium]